MKKAKGLNPKTLPAMSYCKRHRHYINLPPHCSCMKYGDLEFYYVVCADCGKSNIKDRHATPIIAIKDWNKRFGVCAK